LSNQHFCWVENHKYCWEISSAKFNWIFYSNRSILRYYFTNHNNLGVPPLFIKTQICLVD